MRRAKVQDLSGKEDAIILIAGIVLAVTLGMVEATGKILRLSGEFLDRCTGLHGLSGKCRPGVLTMTVKTFPGLRGRFRFATLHNSSFLSATF